jgi:NAD+ diphosphatase
VDSIGQFQYCPRDGSRLTAGNDGRPACSQCGFIDYQNPKPCVAIIIVDATGQVLLGRRRFEPRRGMWDIPGGFIDRDESAEEAVVRECREETSLEIAQMEYLGSVSDAYDDRGTRTLNLVFLVRQVIGKECPADDVAELRWFAASEIPAELAFPHQSHALQWALDRLGG